MKSETFTTKVTATFNDEKTHRFVLHKEWDKKMKSAIIIMKCPSSQNLIETDTTTMLVINNLAKLGYGSVYLTNLYSILDGTNITKNDTQETQNFQNIVSISKEVDSIIIAWGSFGEGNNAVTEKQNRLLEQLLPNKGKTFHIAHPLDETKGQHPLSPHVRNHWNLVQYVFPEKSSPKVVKVNTSTENVEEVKNGN